MIEVFERRCRRGAVRSYCERFAERVLGRRRRHGGKRLQKARGAGVTVLISTHDPNAAQYGDRVMKMEHGRLTQEN